MAKTKKKKDRSVNLIMFVKGRVSTILGLVFVILFLAASVGIPLSYYFNNKVTLWTSMGFLFGSALFSAKEKYIKLVSQKWAPLTK